MKKIARTAVVMLTLATTACSTQPTNEDLFGWTGAAIGAAAGGWLGSQIGGGTGKLLYTISGAIIGGSAGYETGRSLMFADRPSYNNAVAEALSGSGKSLWDNPTTGTGGYIRAGQAYLDGNGTHCRNFTATVAFNDDVLNGPGAACRTGDGDWVLVADAFQ